MNDYLFTETLDVFLGGLGGVDVDNDSLNGSNARRKDQTLVVTVDHDHHTNGTSGQTPTVLPDVLAF